MHGVLVVTAGRDGRSQDRKSRSRRRTRQAMIVAAQGFLAEGKVSVSVQEITARADVDTGSFYTVSAGFVWYPRGVERTRSR